MEGKESESTQRPELGEAEKDLPTTAEATSATEDSFEEDVTPIWAEWNKDVGFATYKSAYVSAAGKQ